MKNFCIGSKIILGTQTSLSATPAIRLIAYVAIKTAGLLPVFVSKLFEELIKDPFFYFLLHGTTMLVCTISKKRRRELIFFKRTLDEQAYLL